MKSLSGAKFVMICLTCLVLDDYGPIRRYKGYSVVARTEAEEQKVKEYAQRLDILLQLPLPLGRSERSDR